MAPLIGLLDCLPHQVRAEAAERHASAHHGALLSPQVRFLPGLFYDRGDEAITRAAPSIPFTLALPMEAGSRLRFLLAAYSLNGTYLGLQVRLECASSAP
jgi:hypothetical protein